MWLIRQPKKGLIMRRQLGQSKILKSAARFWSYGCHSPNSTYPPTKSVSSEALSRV
ncbi:hypothetical protein ACLOJK_004090 [Asimina triloba]